jgi:hypothetical protein
LSENFYGQKGRFIKSTPAEVVSSTAKRRQGEKAWFENSAKIPFLQDLTKKLLIFGSPLTDAKKLVVTKPRKCCHVEEI